MGLVWTVFLSLVVYAAASKFERNAYLDKLKAFNLRYNDEKRGADDDWHQYQLQNDNKKSAVSAVKFNVAACVKNTNMYRRKEKGTKDLIWDDKLARQAERWAVKLAKESQKAGKLMFYHSHGKDRDGAGENIYWGILPRYKNPGDCRPANKAWFSEIKNFDFVKHGVKKSKSFGVIGHFTQLEWKGTKKFGIGIARGKFGKYYNWYTFPQYFIVARYSPAGNNGEPFSKEIGAPKVVEPIGHGH